MSEGALAIGAFFDPDELGAILIENRLHPREIVASLADLAHHADKESVRLGALREARSIIKDAYNASNPTAVATRKVQRTDDQGNTVTESVTFHAQLVEATSHERKARSTSTHIPPVQSVEAPGAAGDPAVPHGGTTPASGDGAASGLDDD